MSADTVATATAADTTAAATSHTIEPPRTHIRPGTLVGLDNPLLDVTCIIDAAFLHQHGLQSNGALVLNRDTDQALFTALRDLPEADCTAGGSVQNALRVAQWILGGQQLDTRGACVFIGSVGADPDADRMQLAAEAIGVHVRYQRFEAASTGVCYVLVNGDQRSLCADLGAAKLLEMSFVFGTEHHELLEAAELFYMSGFFVDSHPDVARNVAHGAHHLDRTLVFNIGAVFVAELHPAAILELLPYVHILIGNAEEMQSLARLMTNIASDDCAECVRHLVHWPPLKRSNGSASVPADVEDEALLRGHGRTVVMTQGAGDVIVAKPNWLGRFAVTPMAAAEIVDTNGAGDAFAGGFLAQLMASAQSVASIEECVRCGIWAAKQIIGRRGCSVAGDMTYRLCDCALKTCEME